MAEHGSLRERILGLQSSAPGAIDAFDAAEQASAEVEAAVEPQVVEEQRGLGEAAFNSVEAAEIAMLQRKIKALKNPKFHGPLIERIAVIRAEAKARLTAE